MTIDPKILSKTVKAIAPKEDIATETQVRGTVVISQGGKYVHLDGAAEGVLTPVVDALGDGDSHGFTHGDRVLVLLKDHQALVTKNISDGLQTKTAIAAGEKAYDAWTKADDAEKAAGDAWAYARDAETAATAANGILDDMQNAALDAGTTLTQIYQDAIEAKTSASNASEYASRALGNLSTVQSVSETLNWITSHGTMTKTGDYIASSDTEVVEGKKYYTRSGSGTSADPYVYTLVANPTGNPSTSGYYEGKLDPSHVYFIRDNNGDYTVGGLKYSVVSEPNVADISTYYELSIDESLNNYVATHLAVDSEGLWIIPDAGGNKVLIATGSGSIYTTAGTYIVGTGNVVLASFTASGAVIGENASGKSRTEIGSAGMQIYRNVSGWDTQIANLGYGVGASGGGTTNNAPYYTFGERKKAAAPYDPSTTWSLGNMCKYNDELYVCIHEITTPEAWNADHWRYYIGNYSVAEGLQPIACGYASHAEGVDVEAIGDNSHAEGSNAMAIGDLSHAEGLRVKAKGDYSHAEGAGTRANGHISHAEGCDTIANGEFSHAQNYNTKASSDSQTALGKYNVEDNADTYAVIVGNGTDNNARSNALAVDWDGNVYIRNATYKVPVIFIEDTAPTSADGENGDIWLQYT